TPWGEFLAKARRGRNQSSLPGRMLCLDPGDTVGWSLFVDGELFHAAQFSTDPDHLSDLIRFVIGVAPTHVVMENYKVYAHRAAQHVGSEVNTIQYIGVFKLAAEQLGVPLTLQMAFQAKKFADDDKLHAWD